MRLIGSDTLPSLKATTAKARPALDRLMTQAGAGLDRLTPYRERFSAEVRKRPKLMMAIAAVVGTWTTLVDSFCAMIDPYLSRFFPQTRLVADVEASGDIALHRVVKGTTIPLGSLALLDAKQRSDLALVKWTAIELRLRPDQLLQRTLNLPTASRDFLGPIIEHKLERLTPWRRDRVLFGYRVIDDANAGSGVNVTFTATSKDFIAAPLKALGDAGFVPTAVGAQQELASEPLAVNLLHDTAKGTRIGSRRLVSRIAMVSFAALSLAYMAASLWASSAAGQQHEAGVRLMKARHLLKSASMGAVGDRERALLEAKQPDHAMVVLIDKLATAIPENTYLKELAVTPDKVRLVGSSGNAPSLIGALETTGLANVRFTSAVTREKDQKDSFEITANRATSKAADTP